MCLSILVSGQRLVFYLLSCSGLHGSYYLLSGLLQRQIAKSVHFTIDFRKLRTMTTISFPPCDPYVTYVGHHQGFLGNGFLQHPGVHRGAVHTSDFRELCFNFSRTMQFNVFEQSNLTIV